jgi:RNA polymerase sigma factor (sigma-70 family)
LTVARVQRPSAHRRRPDSRLHSPVRTISQAPARSNPLPAEVYLSPRKVDLFSFDAEYLRKLKAHEPATESHFASYFKSRLDIKLRHRGFPPSTVEDIRQDTLLRVIDAVQRGQVQFPERFGAFVASVCDNVIRENYRSITRLQYVDVETIDVPDHRTNIEAQVLRKERRKIVADIVEDMPAKKRDILRALLHDHLERDELCERFGVNGDYLRVLLFRAKEEFTCRLKAKGLNDPDDTAPGDKSKKVQ